MIVKCTAKVLFFLIYANNFAFFALQHQKTILLCSSVFALLFACKFAVLQRKIVVFFQNACVNVVLLRSYFGV